MTTLETFPMQWFMYQINHRSHVSSVCQMDFYIGGQMIAILGNSANRACERQ